MTSLGGRLWGRHKARGGTARGRRGAQTDRGRAWSAPVAAAGAFKRPAAPA